MKKTIVISAVNIRKGGTLTILRDCLAYLSTIAEDYRIVAIIHKKELCDYPGIEYIEMPDTIKGWGRRLKAEYISFNKISKQLAPVYLWFSLHDTTPRVHAEHQAVYCQTSFPFMKAKWQDLRFDPKVVLFTLFTRFAYKVNVRRNDFLVVQTQWLREGLSKMLKVDKEKFIVAPPKVNVPAYDHGTMIQPPVLIYPATPDCHKNFETLCEAARLLENEIGAGKFKVLITVNGTENKYAAWLKQKWGDVKSIDFHGLVKREELFRLYSEASALVFPSRVETWGLPISEFAETGRPLLLSDLPYAHETAAGRQNVAYFKNDDPFDLKSQIVRVLNGDAFEPAPRIAPQGVCVTDWEQLFKELLNN